MEDGLILITGGAGYIGSHVVKLLLEKKRKVVVVDDLSAGHKEVIEFFLRKFGTKNFIFEKVDILDERKLKKILNEINKKYKITGIIDFAAKIAVGESQKKPLEYFKVNVVGFRNLLLATDSIPVVKSSTAAVYGGPDQKDIPLKEGLLGKIVREKRFKESQLLPADVSFDTLMKWYEKEISDECPFLKLEDEDIKYLFIPCNVYGITKMMCEIMLKKFEKKTGRCYAALRYFNAAGADKSGLIGEDHNPETHLIPIVLKVALGKIKNIEIFGDDYNTEDGTCIRDYISVLDLADVHIIALNYLIKEGKSKTFNLGTNKGYTVKEIIELSEKITARNIPIIIGKRREGDSPALIADASLIKKELGWSAKYEIKEIISSAWKWHKSHPDGFNSR